MRLTATSITFPVIWSSVLISVTWEWRYCGLVYKFFLINNIELKCSFVRCRKYHKSWSNGAAELHISVDLLWDTTTAELHNSVDLLCVTTAAEPHNSVNLLRGTTAAELNRFDACTRSRRHFPKTETNHGHAEKYEGLIQSKITANFWKMNALDDSTNTDRCALYEDSANFLKDERLTKTEYQTSQESPHELARQSEAKLKQAPQSEANVCRRRRRKCNVKKTSLINCTGYPIMHRTPNTN